MKTVIAPTGRTIDVVTHELTDAEAARITATLAELGIAVAPVIDIYHVLHLWAQQPLSTRQEVTLLRAFWAETDARLVLHQVEVNGQ